jgi:hypothetical protein
MKVHQLIDKLLSMPEQDAIVVVPAFDHSYREIDCISDTYSDFCNGNLSEYYEDMGDEPQGKIIPVVVII